MCEFNGLGYANSAQAQAAACNEPEPSPEILLARAFKDDLNVDINPTSLRMFVRARWARVSTLAHKIHDAGGAL
jgi:hypothetical protein